MTGECRRCVRCYGSGFADIDQRPHLPPQRCQRCEGNGDDPSEQMLMLKLADIMKEIADLRDEQRESGDPIISCGYCGGDTRMLRGREQQLVECETCGGHLMMLPTANGWDKRLLRPGPSRFRSGGHRA